MYTTRVRESGKVFSVVDTYGFLVCTTVRDMGILTVFGACVSSLEDGCPRKKAD